MNSEGYRKLEIYRLAHHLAIEIHSLSLKLPRHELFEEGSQIRRSSKSISPNIVEGYCLRNHTRDFLLYLQRAYASANETIEHLDILFETASFSEKATYERLRNEYERLCGMLFKFIQRVSDIHSKPFSAAEEQIQYELGTSIPSSEIENP